MKIFDLDAEERGIIFDRLASIDNILVDNLKTVIKKEAKTEADYTEIAYISFSKIIINSALIIFNYDNNFISLQFKIPQLRTLLESLARSNYIITNPQLSQEYLEEAENWQSSNTKCFDGSQKINFKNSKKKLRTFKKPGLVEDELIKLSPAKDKNYLYNIFCYCSIVTHPQDLTTKYLLGVANDENLMISQIDILYYHTLFAVETYLGSPTSKLSSLKGKKKLIEYMNEIKKVVMGRLELMRDNAKSNKDNTDD